MKLNLRQQLDQHGAASCKRCGVHSDWINKAYTWPLCKPCKSNSDRLYRQRNKERCSTRKKQYWIENKDRLTVENRLKRILYGAKSRAKFKKWEFNLTVEYLHQLFIAQEYKCSLTGFSITDQNFSLDRINSSKGYVVGNVQLTTVTANKMKLDMTTQQFIDYCKSIINHAITAKTAASAPKPDESSDD